jgi:hypothetical protein
VADEALYTEDRVPPIERVLGIRGRLGERAIKHIKQNMRGALGSAKPTLPAHELKILERTVADFLALPQLPAAFYLTVSVGYADLPLGKGFGVVFSKSDPGHGTRTQCVLRGVINEWMPIAMDGIPRGHRSVCLFDFPAGVPELVAELPEVSYPTPLRVEERLYLCTQETWELRQARSKGFK